MVRVRVSGTPRNISFAARHIGRSVYISIGHDLESGHRDEEEGQHADDGRGEKDDLPVEIVVDQVHDGREKANVRKNPSHPKSGAK